MTLIEKRKAKYPDTSTFKYHNANPKNKITSDCVVRALSAGMQKPYNEVVMELASLQCETGFAFGSNELIDRYLQKNGWKRCKQPKKDNGKKYTGKEFCLALSDSLQCSELELASNLFDWQNIVAKIGSHHIVAIIQGKVHDIWDSTDGSIGIIWMKEQT